MALITCKECGKDISDQAAACPGCGAPVQSTQPAMPAPPKSLGDKKVGCGTVILVFGLLGLLGLAVVMAIDPVDPAASAAQQHDRDVIDLCWKDYGRRSLDPQTKRFVAEVCEKMESDFKQKFGREP